MALGDKLPVVMGKEKAVANGVATLGTDGKLAKEQRPSAEDIGGVTAPALPGVEGQLFGVGANGLTEWVTQDAEPTENSANPVQSGGVYTALAGKADLTLSNLINYQKALRNIGGQPGRNLLDNWYFVGGGTSGKFPINQRGQTSYTGPGYAIDRWKIPGDGGTLTVNQNGITYQNTTENTAHLSEYLELSSLIPGEQYTMSALFAGGSAAKAAEFVCYRPGSPGYSVFTGNAVEGAGLSSVTFIVPEDTTSLEARMITWPYGTTGDFTAIAAKLELGDRQTLAYQDDEGNWRLYEIPDYAEELLRCQRYAQVITQWNQTYFAKTYLDENSINFNIPITATMRKGNPTVDILSNGEIRLFVSGKGDQEGFTFTAYNCQNLIRLTARKQNHGITNSDYVLLIMNNVLLSLEL